MTDKYLLSSESGENELGLERSLRPQLLFQYIGQREVKQELRTCIEAARNREKPSDHVLLYGPPGLGKTTTAMITANKMTVNIRTTSDPAIGHPDNLITVLNELEARDVLFIDETHRLPRVVEEVLYLAMEDFYVDTMVRQRPTAYPIHFPPPSFTLIDATTQTGMLSAPLRDRSGIISHMEYYDERDLQEIVLRSSDIFQTEIIEEGALEIAHRSRGTPRIANRLLKRVRDFTQVQGDRRIDRPIADQALTLLQVDQAELDYVDQELLQTVIELYGGGPVGPDTLPISIGEERETVEDMYEPYLIQKGFLKHTPRGQIATTYACEHFSYDYHI